MYHLIAKYFFFHMKQRTTFNSYSKKFKSSAPKRRVPGTLCYGYNERDLRPDSSRDMG